MTEGEGEGQYLRHLSYYTEVEEGGGLRGEKEKTNDPHQINIQRETLFLAIAKYCEASKIIMTKVDSSHLQKSHQTHCSGGGGIYTRASSPKEGRIGSELLRWIIFLPVHPALDVTRIQLAPPSTVFHTSLL